MVKYKIYLQRSFPITTGAVESACGHFLKSEWIELNAVGKEGSTRNIRAVKKNDDWE